MPREALVPVGWVLDQAGANQSAPVADVDLTAVQAGELLGRAASTIRGMCASGELLGAYRARGREWRVPRAALSAWQREEARRHAEKVTPPRRVRANATADLGAWRKLKAGYDPAADAATLAARLGA
jgi:excisionase family DNA binding protein